MRYVGDSIAYLNKSSEEYYSLRLPTYHRAAIGLFPGTRVFLVPVPRSQELIVSPIRPDNWGDIWKLEASLRDMPGAVHSIIKTLRDSKVNILVEEGLSESFDDRHDAHHLFTILDLNQYINNIDGSTDTRNSVATPHIKPNYLINQIISNASAFLLTAGSGEGWALNFERMRFFYDYKHLRLGSTRSRYFSKEGLRIPNEVIDRSIFQRRPPEKIACHVISDTEEKYLKIKFLSPTDKRLLLGIKHREEIGAIFQFTQILARRNINIVNSYSRIASMDEIAYWNCFLEIPPRFKIKGLQELCDDLNEEPFVTEFFLRGYHGFDDEFDVAEAVAELKLEKYSGLLISGEPVDHVEKVPPKERPPRKPSAIEKKLDLRPFYSDKPWSRRLDHVFVAMPFERAFDHLYQKYIKEILERNGFVAFRSDKEVFDTESVVVEKIRQEIAECSFMVADVTKNNANVLYEIGLAHAIGRKVLIIKQELEDGSFNIGHMPQLIYAPFEIDEFIDKFEKQIRFIGDQQQEQSNL